MTKVSEYLTIILCVSSIGFIIATDQYGDLAACNTISCVSGNQLWQGYVFMCSVISIYAYHLYVHISVIKYCWEYWLSLILILSFQTVGFFPTTVGYTPSDIYHLGGVLVSVIGEFIVFGLLWWNAYYILFTLDPREDYRRVLEERIYINCTKVKHMRKWRLLIIHVIKTILFAFLIVTNTISEHYMTVTIPSLRTNNQINQLKLINVIAIYVELFLLLSHFQSSNEVLYDLVQRNNKVTELTDTTRYVNLSGTTLENNNN